ncbi:MAG: hypothetical protein U1F43_06400 [Myxococcota bacterium]
MARLPTLAVLVLALASASPAQARPHERERDDLYAVVTQAEAELDGPTLSVTLALDGQSFAWLQSQGIAPSIVAEVGPSGLRYEMPMRGAYDTMQVVLPQGVRPRPLRVTLGGGDGRRDIDGLVVGGLELSALELRVHRVGGGGGGGQVAPHLAWPGQPQVIKACGDTFEGAQNEGACLDATTRFAYDPSDMIAVCDAVMEGDADELACVAAAAQLRGPEPDAFRACDDAMEGDVDELACVSALWRASFDPSGAIRACDAAMEGDVNELACVTLAVQAPVDPSALIATCDEAMAGDDAELQCVRRGIGL